MEPGTAGRLGEPAVLLIEDDPCDVLLTRAT